MKAWNSALARCACLMAMLAIFGVLAVVRPAFAQAQSASNWPSRPIRLVVSWPPGGGADIVARMLAKHLEANLRQPIVIDNRAGGGGTVGALTVVHADPDGYTLLFASDAELTIAPVVNAAANYNPAKDLAPISLVSSGPFMLVANPKFPPNTLQELIAYAKTNPGKVNYGSFGPGTNGHMLGEQLKAIAHIDTIHVAYKGSAPAMVDLIGGEIQYAFFSPMAALDMVKAGKIKSIAVLAPERLANAGTIPTSAEAGLPALVGGTRFGILAPAKTPRYVIDRMHEAVKTTLASPEVKASLAQLYTLPIGSSPDEFTKFITTETGKWRKLAADIGMRAE